MVTREDFQFEGLGIKYEVWDTFKDSRVSVRSLAGHSVGVTIGEVWNYGSRMNNSLLYKMDPPTHILDAGFMYMNSEYKDTMSLFDFLSNLFAGKRSEDQDGDGK